MAAQKFDLAVVGTGPGGYVAAIRASQLGLKVAVVEEDRPGGVCLNWGCIPTKALLRNAEVLDLVQRAQEFGISVGPVKADYAQAIARSRKVADRLSKGIEFLFKKNKITLFPGRGRLTAPTQVVVKTASGEETIEAKHVIVATGSEPKSLPGVTIDEKRIISSTGALKIDQAPASLLIIGAGAVGVEFADVYAAYGVKVTLLEALPRVVPVEDEEVSTHLNRLFTKRGIEIKTGAKVSAVTMDAKGVTVNAAVDGKAEQFTVDQVLMAVGRQAKTEGLGLEALGVAMEKGFVKVTPQMGTSLPGLYAIGDLAGPPLLAHKAMAEGVVAAETIAGRKARPVDYGNVPSCTYCRPQIASLGLTETQARERGHAISVGRFPFQASGKALALGETDGFVKVVADKTTGEILGAHILGAEATELIHEFAIGRTVEATLEEIIHTVHAHPTMSEASLEASLGALGQAIHI
ncbi:MAG TPA: dihydrolipoyl dehydrogenase [Methylomirabilota bacterium]|nr:dihydrolipoyl dehydrogenase [Methylomirabilota bacterium]